MRNFLPLFLLTSAASAQYYVISTVGGSGQLQPTAGGGRAVDARLVTPRAIVAGREASVYFADPYFNQVFRIGSDGILTVVAGAGRQGFSGDNGPAAEALLDTPTALAFDASGNLYIADQANSRIRRVTPGGIISTVANLGGVTGLAFDSVGNLYASQASIHTIRRITPAGVASVFVGNGTGAFSGDNGPAASASLFGPTGIDFDADGNLFIADTQNQRVRRVTPTGVISTVAGDGNGRFAGDNGPAINASFALPTDVALDAAGNLYITDSSNGRLRMVTRQGIISTVAGGGTSYTDGPALQAALAGLASVAIDSNGALLVAAPTARQIRRIAQQTITTLAGIAPIAGAGDNLSALSASLLNPFGVALDPNGNVLVSDAIDNRVRRISPSGIITTAAGNGLFNLESTVGPATSITVGAPRGLAYDGAGNLFITSGAGATIRRVTPAGVLSTIAGGAPGSAGDNGPAVSALFLVPIGAAADANGNLFIADSGNHRIRRIDAATQIVTTVAGTGIAGFSGDGGPAGAAQLSSPRFVTFDRAGNLYITDTGNNRIRRVTPAGNISTISGNGAPGSTGDNGPATAAALGAPTGFAIDSTNNFYIATNNYVRKVAAASQTITTIAGNGTAAFSGDGALATTASLDGPQSPVLDSTGAIYFADQRNFRVRKLTPAQIVAEGVTNAATIKAGPIAPGEIVSIFGFDLGPTPPVGVQLDSAGRVSIQTGGTRVTFDGVPAPLLYVSPTQINAVVPYAVAPNATTRVQVTYQGRPTNTIMLPTAAASPGLFAITNQDGGVNSAANPAAPNSVLVLYGTGEGQTNPAGVDGSVANSVFPKPVLDVSVEIAGQPATILYSGAAPGFVAGVLQVNVAIPAGVTGAAPLQLKIGDSALPAPINIHVR